MLSITPINNKYYNRTINFKGNPQISNSGISFKADAKKENPYTDLYEKMKALEIKYIEEQEVIPPQKEVKNIQNLTPTKPQKLETLPYDKDGWTELHCICTFGDLAEFKEFVKRHPNFNPNQRNKEGFSYIRKVVYRNGKGHKTFLNTLAANKNLDLNITDDRGWNDLHDLCYYGEFDAVKTFVENHPNFDPYQLTKYGDSYIDLSKLDGHYDVAKFLTKHIKKIKKS